ncbi:MAG: hypothetical protein HUJ95_06325, partial [Bacteroidales bacterium]|nr:hypothetical protein [Bacteroidales bacterium]
AKKDPLFAEVVQQNQKKEELESELEKAPADKVVSIKKELIKVTNNLNLTLSQMLPPAGSTPQEQRNYFSARKVAVTTKNVKQLRLCWICNYCGCAHSHPSDCVKPYLGGKWEYETVTTDYTEYVKK